MNTGLWGRAAWVPDLLAVTLVFWSVHQPLRIGVGVAFVFGLTMDVQQGALLGQHAMAYTVLGFLAVSMHRRCCGSACPPRRCRCCPC
ncbi:rod shape-determining protein MreD [Hydrogenophaga sp. T4]|nr:rod shape-determining protein MreD [Hydrogenophaga sp. T4]